ncbi:ABC transporter permease [Jeotgalibacillus marinus]|uniref:Iron ABC transporter permease n=1 Tax=Jeotgalibacillus marinus TaxID=86667 RepID=A0ABV3PZT6_9BACL
MVIPIIYIGIRSFDNGSQRWLELLDTRIPFLLEKTLSLTLTVTFLGLIIGVVSAILVVKTNLPGRRVWRWLLVVPLTIPAYVGAVSYIILFGPRGLVDNLFGTTIDVFSFPMVVLIITGFTYPYIYLIVSASLQKINPSFEEAGYISGLSHFGVIRKVTIPMVRPAIGSGAILVALYVVSDFGSVAMLRYPTFTQAIYFQMGSFDRVGASIFSMILIVITLVFLGIQYASKRRMKFYQVDGTSKAPTLIDLGKWKVPALIFVSTVFGLFAALPIGVLLYWSGLAVVEGVIDSRFFAFTMNSFMAAAITSLLCLVLALPLIYVKTRFNSGMSRIVDVISYLSYALPGVIVALGVIFIFINYIPFLYGTIAMLIMAYVMRFLPQSLQSTESSMGQISPKIDEAALSLGKKPVQVLNQVILRLIQPGIIASFSLVFVSVIKELPATLLLRPAGFDTLAVRVWIETSEGYYAMAAPSALLIILISILPIRWIMNKY